MVLLWVKVLHLTKSADFLQKNANANGFLVLKGIFSETKYVFVLTHQISISWHNSDEFYTGSTPTAKLTPKKLTQIKLKHKLL